MKKIIFALFVLSATTQAFSQQEEKPRYGNIGPAYIGGMEFWPFDDSIPGSPYPDRVLWSYGEGSDPAKACMLKGNKQLVKWLEDPQSPVAVALKEYAEIGGTSSFFQWTNDYTKAPSQAARGTRKSRVWWWSGSGSETSGWLKYESTVLPDGTCQNPQEEQIVSYLESRYHLFGAVTPSRVDNQRRREGSESSPQSESHPQSESSSSSDGR